PRLGDLVAVEGEGRVIPRALTGLLAPVGVGARQDSTRALDPDLSERLPEWMGRLLEQDVRELDHRPFAELSRVPGPQIARSVIHGAYHGSMLAWYVRIASDGSDHPHASLPHDSCGGVRRSSSLDHLAAAN